MALLWRVFATNAAVLVAATLVLVLTPATVSFPLAAQEAVVLAVGLALLLGLDFLLLRRAVGRDSLERVRGMLAAQEGERLRVARELHDEVGPDAHRPCCSNSGARRARRARAERRSWPRRRRRRAQTWRRCAASRASCGPRRSTTSAWPARWWR